MRVRRNWLPIVVGTLSFALFGASAPVHADSVSIFNDPTNPVTLTLITSSGSLVAGDTRGLALGIVASTAGAVAIGDFGSSFPNSLLLSVNFPGFTESIVIALDYSSLTINPGIVTGATTLVPGFAAPFSGTITDSSLQALLAGPLIFSFSFSSAGLDPQNPNQMVSQWTLNGVQVVKPVPEPATLLLMGTGLVGMLARRRHRLGRHT